MSLTGTHGTSQTLAPSPRELVARFVRERYDQPTRVAEIAGALSLEIIEGDRPPGSQLNSVALARSFVTSRTPVREALMLLENEGLVDLPPRRRPRVSRPDMTDIRENYEMRAELMGIVASAVAQSGSHQDVAGLRERFSAMQAAARLGAPDGYFWANVMFHERAVEIAGNALRRRILDSLFLRALRFRRLSLSLPGRQTRSLEDHAVLIRAMEERDPNLAGAMMRSIILTALSAVEQHPDYLRDAGSTASNPPRRRPHSTGAPRSSDLPRRKRGT